MVLKPPLEIRSLGSCSSLQGAASATHSMGEDVASGTRGPWRSVQSQ